MSVKLQVINADLEVAYNKDYNEVILVMTSPNIRSIRMLRGQAVALASLLAGAIKEYDEATKPCPYCSKHPCGCTVVGLKAMLGIAESKANATDEFQRLAQARNRAAPLSGHELPMGKIDPDLRSERAQAAFYAKPTVQDREHGYNVRFNMRSVVVPGQAGAGGEGLPHLP